VETCGAFGYLISGVWILGGIVIHLWTILLTLGEYGLFWAVVAFCAPIVSEMYWMVESTHQYGFLNLYNLLIIFVFVIKWGGTLLIAGISDAFEKRDLGA
jgi:hypothetical protein